MYPGSMGSVRNVIPIIHMPECPRNNDTSPNEIKPQLYLCLHLSLNCAVTIMALLPHRQPYKGTTVCGR